MPESAVLSKVESVTAAVRVRLPDQAANAHFGHQWVFHVGSVEIWLSPVMT